MRFWRSKRFVRGGIAVVGLLVGFLWFIGVIGGNFREVVPGKLYRSAQLSGRNLEGAIEAGHIRSIINLRGNLHNDPAYLSELAICKEKGIAHDDLRLSASHLPPPKELNRLIEDFDRLPKPILVHCNAGADRSGLAATLYLALMEGVSLDEAENRQLTWRFAHFRWFKARAMNEFLELYRTTSAGKELRSWILESYPSLYGGLPASSR